MRLRLAIGTGIGLAALLLAPQPALADTPLSSPTNLVALHVSDTAAELSWLSTGLSARDVVQRNVNGGWQTYATGVPGYLALTNLSPGTTYTFRVFSVPFTDLGYSASAPSAPVSFTTLAQPDNVPPAPASAPTFSSITTTVASMFWPEATDNVQVTGYYVQQLTGAGWTTIRTVTAGARFQTLSGLTASTTYTFAVIAFDARGNTSARSAAGSFTTLALTANPTCRVQVIPFSPGFTATVSIINTTAAPLTNWTVRFTLPATAVVNYTFNGTTTRDGATATITPMVWNATVGPGGTAMPGLSGSATPFVPPSNFTVADLPCVAG